MRFQRISGGRPLTHSCQAIVLGEGRSEFVRQSTVPEWMLTSLRKEVGQHKRCRRLAFWRYGLFTGEFRDVSISISITVSMHVYAPSCCIDNPVLGDIESFCGVKSKLYAGRQVFSSAIVCC